MFARAARPERRRPRGSEPTPRSAPASPRGLVGLLVGRPRVPSCRRERESGSLFWRHLVGCLLPQGPVKNPQQPVYVVKTGKQKSLPQRGVRFPARPTAPNGTRRSPRRGVSDCIAGSPEVHVDVGVGVAAHVSARPRCGPESAGGHGGAAVVGAENTARRSAPAPL